MEQSLISMEPNRQYSVCVETLKDRIATFFYFNISSCDYLSEIEGYLIDEFTKDIMKFISDSLAKNPNQDVDALITSTTTVFNDILARNSDTLHTFLEESIFKISRNIKLKQFEELDKAMEEYNPEESDKLDQEIRDIQLKIQENKRFIKGLKENLDKIKSFDKSLQELEL